MGKFTMSRSARITLLLVIDVVFFFVELIVEAIERFFNTAGMSYDSDGIATRLYAHIEISNAKLVVVVGSLGLASNIVGLFLFHGQFAAQIVRPHTDSPAEHGHSHGHSHSHGTTSVPASKPASITSVSENNAKPVRDPSPSRSRSVARQRSDSYASFSGHPAATRASLVQVAQDMALASSPPTTRQGQHDVTRDTPSRHASTVGNSFAAQEPNEETPLISGHSHASDDHDHASTSSQTVNAGEHSHGHSHGSSMNMQALLLHVSDFPARPPKPLQFEHRFWVTR
ncbi:hypothetical protein HWV62_41216 [Athelia sp. TMB]|nr:hypothetical protein HWV62_41216 [Athelia sp. TMB]